MKSIYRIAISICFASLLLSCSEKSKLNIKRIEGKRISIDSAITSNSSVEKFIEPYRKELNANMQKVLSMAPFNFVKNDGELQSTLGNLLADLSYEMINPLFFEKTNKNIDFVLMNSGGLRAPIPKGEVTTETAYFLMPFDNEFVVTKLSGIKAKELFNYFVKNRSAHPLSSQVHLIIDEKNFQLKINGETFDENKSYYVLTNDYLQSGGDGMTFFSNPEELISLDYKVRDAIIDYFTLKDTLYTKIDNRVILKK